MIEFEWNEDKARENVRKHDRGGTSQQIVSGLFVLEAHAQFRAERFDLALFV